MPLHMTPHEDPGSETYLGERPTLYIYYIICMNYIELHWTELYWIIYYILLFLYAYIFMHYSQIVSLVSQAFKAAHSALKYIVVDGCWLSQSRHEPFASCTENSKSFGSMG